MVRIGVKVCWDSVRQVNTCLFEEGSFIFINQA